jgi:hypothetical protein
MRVAVPQAPTAWASNFAPGDVSSTNGYALPAKLATHPTGIVLIAIVYGTKSTASARPWRGYPPRSLPLDLHDATVQHQWEGMPNLRVPRYVVLARTHGYLLEVDALFDTQHPSAGLLASAEHELATFTLPTAPSTTTPRSSPPPVYIGRYQARGVLSGEGSARLAQNSALDVPKGQHRQLLDLRGIGTLTLACTAHPSGAIRLTTWARGEGPPVIQHIATQPTRPMALAPYPAAGGPVNLPAHGSTPQTFEYWQITIISEAFSANATILGLITHTQNGCDLSAEATVISHGQFYRYAR